MHLFISEGQLRGSSLKAKEAHSKSIQNYIIVRRFYERVLCLSSVKYRHTPLVSYLPRGPRVHSPRIAALVDALLFGLLGRGELDQPRRACFLGDVFLGRHQQRHRQLGLVVQADAKAVLDEAHKEDRRER